MADYTTTDIRNVALVGHAGAGKTSLAEALLEKAGAIHSLGRVDKGTTVNDFDVLEQKHQHSLEASIASFEYQGTQINLIDTPGGPDFVGTALSVLPAVETVIGVINAQNGVEGTTRRMMEWALQASQCRMLVVNKVDVPGVDLEALYEEIREAFGSMCLAVNLPAAGASTVVDCFFEPDGDSDFTSVEEAHTAIMDQVVEVDEELMATYLDQGEVALEQLHEPFEQALREAHLVPVCFVSAESGAGIIELLEVISRLMPNPTEGNPRQFVNGSEEATPLEWSANGDEPLLGHVFKVAFDPFVGRQAYFRVHQGTIKKDGALFVDDARKAVKAANMSSPLGKDAQERSIAIPGDVMMLAKVDAIRLNSVLQQAQDDTPPRLDQLSLPMPMVGLSVSPKNRGDEQKIAEALNKLTESDPCLRIERNPSANETILRGMGDLHLRIAIERMKEQYGIEVETSTPTVPYRETISRKAEGHCRHKKQTGGAGQFGEVYLRVEPRGRGAGFEFTDAIVGGVIPSQFIPAVEKGVRQVLEGGAFAGFPIQDIHVTVYDGKYHAVDSKEVAFVAAGRKAFLDAIGKASPVVLEPIADVEITAPSGSMGDIAGDLSSRRGRVSNTDSRAGGIVAITGQAPLAEMDDYQSKLKSMTGGEGDFAMHFSAYEPAPADVQKRLSNAFQRPEEE
jgi:elongation factor G